MLLPLLALALPQSDLPTWSAFPGDGAVSIGSDHVHDPTVVNIRNSWFVFSTSGNGFGVVRSSRDMKSWKVHGPLDLATPKWLAGRYRHRSIWAPDILVVGNKVRAYYSASDFGTNKSIIGLAECADFDPAKPNEGWVDRGLVIESKPGEPSNAIDPETVIDAEGRHHMIYGSYFGGIYAVELDPSTGLLKDPARPNPLLVAANTGERGNPLEGAAVLRRGDDYYLFVSYGLAAQGVRSTYRIMVGRSASPRGPYLDRAGKSMAEGGYVEVLKGSPPMFSPGHSDVLQAPDGRTLMPYHFYDGRSYWTDDKWGLPRLQIRELLWNSDGWPLPGLPVEHPHPTGAARPLQPGLWTLQRDFREPIDVRIAADGKLTEGERAGTWTAKGTEATLRLSGDASPLTLGIFYAGTYAVGRDTSGHIVRAVRKGR